ncbi:MAG: hypothetical protein HQK76_12535 [Desulfobacterales bacterium]|nr:hypothetical protein [Desulfobacterales bacterium]
MQINLSLKQHCIQTSIKKVYEKLLTGYFKKFNVKELIIDIDSIETRIEALKFFLENADFGYLRSNYPELNGNKIVDAVLYVPDNKRDMKILLKDLVIEPKWKNILL